MPRVTRCIGSAEHRLDPVVLDQLFERRICLLTTACLGQVGAPIGKQIADGHDFHVRVILETERGAETAHAVSDDTDDTSWLTYTSVAAA